MSSGQELIEGIRLEDLDWLTAWVELRNNLCFVIYRDGLWRNGFIGRMDDEKSEITWRKIGKLICIDVYAYGVVVVL